jgi:hypothetical protein
MLQIIPQDATYRPTPQQMSDLIKFLAERLEISGDWSVGGRGRALHGERDRPSPGRLPVASGGTEAIVSFQDLVSGSLFGYEIDSPDPDENYWADELRSTSRRRRFPGATGSTRRPPARPAASGSPRSANSSRRSG